MSPTCSPHPDCQTMAVTDHSLSPEARLRAAVKSIGAKNFTASDYKSGRLKHIVLFRFKSDVTAAQINEVAAEFANLQQRCLRDGKTYIQSIEYGEQNSGENADQAFMLGFIVTFKSEGDRNYYVGEPLVDDAAYYDQAHHNFKKFVAPLLDHQGVLVFDFFNE